VVKTGIVAVRDQYTRDIADLRDRLIKLKQSPADAKMRRLAELRAMAADVKRARAAYDEASKTYTAAEARMNPVGIAMSQQGNSASQFRVERDRAKAERDRTYWDYLSQLARDPLLGVDGPGFFDPQFYVTLTNWNGASSDEIVQTLDSRIDALVGKL